jgi:hypothetical protein
MLQRPILIFLIGLFTGGVSVATTLGLGLMLVYARAEEKEPIRQFKRPAEERPNLPMPRIPSSLKTTSPHASKAE